MKNLADQKDVTKSKKKRGSVIGWLRRGIARFTNIGHRQPTKYGYRRYWLAP